MRLTRPMQEALAWLETGEGFDWTYDSPAASTLKALERRGLVCWTDDGQRTYWVKPQGGYLDHWYPALTTAGTALARDLEADAKQRAEDELTKLDQEATCA